MWKRRKKQRLLSGPQSLHDEDHVQTGLPRSSPLEWQFPREGEAWDDPVAMPDRDASSHPPTNQRVRSIQAISGILIVLLVSITLYLWRRAESGAQILEEGLRATIAAEASLATTLGSAQDDPDLPSPATTVQVQDITFQGDVVSVQVESTYTESDGQSYILRHRRFYHLTEAGWVRVPAHGGYLGPHQVHQTEFFTFEYRKLDAAAVEERAAKLDAIYTSLRKDFALPSTTERMVVTLLTDPSSNGSPCYLPNHLCVNSPALASLPTTLSESEALQLWLLNQLVDLVRWEALKIQPETYGWDHIMVALSLMQMREHSTLLAAWHTDLMQWFYGTVTRTPKLDETTVAQELARLCNGHQFRAIGPVFVSTMPVHLCMPAPWLDLHSIAQSKPPQRLRQLIKPYPNQLVLTESWSQVLACDTLLSYVLATYGREALPALVEGFRQHASWSTLAPATLGVTAEDLERGWQEYLLQTYQ